MIDTISLSEAMERDALFNSVKMFVLKRPFMTRRVIFWWLIRVCAPLVFALSARAFPFFEPIQPRRASEIMVNGGASGQAPVNSAAALKHCIEDGFEWAQVDLQLTKDGVHVLARSNTFVVGENRPFIISEHSFAELKEIDVGVPFALRFAGERVLSLEECFALARGKLNLCLDCKAVNPEKLAREIIDSGMERQVLVLDSISNLRRIQEMTLGRVALAAKWESNKVSGSWVSSHNLSAVEIEASAVSPVITEDLHALGVKVVVSTLTQQDRPEFWDRAIRAGRIGF